MKMDVVVQFIFRQKLYICDAIIDQTALPYYIFCIFKDKGLIMEFNDEVTIKTDGKELLPKKDDYPALIELRQAILDAVKAINKFH